MNEGETPMDQRKHKRLSDQLKKWVDEIEEPLKTTKKKILPIWQIKRINSNVIRRRRIA